MKSENDRSQRDIKLLLRDGIRDDAAFVRGAN